LIDIREIQVVKQGEKWGSGGGMRMDEGHERLEKQAV